MERTSQEQLLYGELTARIRRMAEPVAHDSFLFYQDTIACLKAEVAAGNKILDAGCGRGTITAWIAEQGVDVVAIDSNEDRVAHTRRLLKERKLAGKAHVEISNLPDLFPQDHFDVILDCFSWWHISDWGKLFSLSRKNLNTQGKLVILDTFFGWKTTLEFRQQMRDRWQTALPTLNECKNMLIKREFRLLRADSIQEQYVRYLDKICDSIHALEKEDLGVSDPQELILVKDMWLWFRDAARKEELAATCIVAELTQP